MFERYTEKARRFIFFARYEASQRGSPYIEVAHLLLGLVREDFPTIRALCKVDRARLQEAIEAICVNSGQKISTSADLPMSQSARQVLIYGAEEAEQLGHQHIGCEHLLLGMLRLPGPEADVLAGFGIGLDKAREVFRAAPSDPAAMPQALRATLAEYQQMLASHLAKLPPDRLEAAFQILAGLGSAYFTARGISSRGPFSYTFGEAPPEF